MTDYDIPSELCYPENIIAIALDSAPQAERVMKLLDELGFTIVPKAPTGTMAIHGERAGIAWMAELKDDVTLREARPSITVEIYKAMVASASARG